MPPLIIRNATLVLADRLLPDGAVFAEGGTITWIGQAAELPLTPDAEIIDAGGGYVSAGLIDLQLNGAFGHDFTIDPNTISTVAAQLPRYGVTAFLPTIITAPRGTIPAAQTTLGAASPPSTLAARPLGLHLEGPFLNPVRRGAHPPEHLRAPDLDEAADWSPATGVRLVTLAPELPGALDLIAALTRRGVVVSLGHTDATFAQAQAGLAAGAAYGTHLFNAMAPLNHREPGIGGALLACAAPVVGLIADGVHVHPGAVALAWRAKGPGGINLVSDAMAGLGLGDGQYRLGERDVTVQGSAARLADGTLAGSVLSLDQAVRNIIQMTGCSIVEAIGAATLVPAAVLGEQNRYGTLHPGAAADLVSWSPELQVTATWIGGQLAYSAERSPVHGLTR